MEEIKLSYLQPDLKVYEVAIKKRILDSASGESFTKTPGDWDDNE